MPSRFELIFLGVLFLACAALLIAGHPSEAVGGLLIAAATTFVNKISTIVDFLFGSSAGSKTKDAALATVINPAKEQPHA